MSDLAKIRILGKFREKCSIDKRHIIHVARGSEEPYLCALGVVSEKYYDHFMNQIERAYLASVKSDVPQGYYLPSEVGISYAVLKEVGLVDSSHKILVFNTS